MLRFELAAPEDIPALTAVQRRTFDDDLQRFGGGFSGGPPGYDDPSWQRHMMGFAAAYYKILSDEQIIGGMIILELKPNHFELGRIWIDPDFQNQGIGRQAMQFLEQAFPQAVIWSLDTPAWAVRNHHFYERMGYVKVHESDGFYFYEKHLNPVPATS